MSKKEYILCASILYKGEIISGFRHADCYKTLDLFNVPKKDQPCRSSQGFLTSKNRHVNRREAQKIAEENKQLLIPKLSINKEPENNYLTSEELY